MINHTTIKYKITIIITARKSLKKGTNDNKIQVIIIQIHKKIKQQNNTKNVEL